MQAGLTHIPIPGRFLLVSRSRTIYISNMRGKGFIVFLVVALVAAAAIILTQKKNPSLNFLCIDKSVDCSVFLSPGQNKPGTSVTVTDEGWYWAGTGSLPACWVGLPDLCIPCDNSDARRQSACSQAFPGYQTEAGKIRK